MDSGRRTRRSPGRRRSAGSPDATPGAGAGAGAGSGSAVDVPEGRRMSKLRQVLETALEMSLKELEAAKTQRQVKRVFTTGSGRSKETIVDPRVALAHTRVAAKEVCDHVREEFDKVVAERGMAAKLNRLDALLESRELVEGQTLPTPGIVDPGFVVRQHVVAMKLEEEKALKDMLQRLENENEALEVRVTEYNNRAKRCNDSMAAKVEVLSQAAARAASFVETQQGH